MSAPECIEAIALLLDFAEEAQTACDLGQRETAHAALRTLGATEHEIETAARPTGGAR